MDNRVDFLLQEIQNAASCRYLSDLRSSSTRIDERAKELISQIPDERYTLEEWNEAAAYMAKTAVRFHSVREAKDNISSDT